MTYVAYATDIGIKKKVNQDSVFGKTAIVNGKPLTLLAICDGMGGLSDGEKASAEAVFLLDLWFENQLPQLLLEGATIPLMEDSITALLSEINSNIIGYGLDNHVKCGTTISAVLFYNGDYLTFNVGDSRVYKGTEDGYIQLTKDQSLVQSLIDKGELAPEDAESHPKKNVLLECLGYNNDFVVDFTIGTYEDGDTFLVCSDGFRHQLTLDEIGTIFHPDKIENQDDLQERVNYAIEVNKSRNERDNISAIVYKVIGVEHE